MLSERFAFMIKDKIKAFITHLLLSLLIALVLAFVVFEIWYPAPLTKATGITKIFIMMLVIDVTIGPLLTFLVYKKGKKTLKMDLFVIVLLQISAIFYGMFFVAEGRPAWLVQVNDRVIVISPSIALDKNNQSIDKRFMQQNWGKPKWATVKFSNDTDAFNIQLDEDVRGKGIVYQPEGYQAYDAKEAKKHAKDLTVLYQYNAVNTVDTVLNQYKDAKLWLPLRGADFAEDLVVLLAGQGVVLDVVELKPWNS